MNSYLVSHIILDYLGRNNLGKCLIFDCYVARLLSKLSRCITVFNASIINRLHLFDSLLVYCKCVSVDFLVRRLSGLNLFEKFAIRNFTSVVVVSMGGFPVCVDIPIRFVSRYILCSLLNDYSFLQIKLVRDSLKRMFLRLPVLSFRNLSFILFRLFNITLNGLFPLQTSCIRVYLTSDSVLVC